MPRLKPVPTLLETCRQYFSDRCIAIVVRNFLELQANNEKVQTELTWCRRNLLKQANKHFKECMIASLRSQLLKIALDQTLDSKLDAMEAIMKSIIYTGWDHHAEKVWDIAQDFIILYGGEGIQELDFSSSMKSCFGDVSTLETRLPKVVLAETLFSNKVWAENITELKFPSLWFVELLETIASNCHNLQHLDISSSFLYDRVQKCVSSQENVDLLGCLYGYQSTSDGLVRKENMGCPKLRTLNFPKFGGHSQVIDHIIQMMQFMPDLHAIRNVDTRLIAAQYMKLFGQQQCMKFTEFEEWESRTCQEEEEQDAVSEGLGKLFPEVKRCASYCTKYSSVPICYEWVLLKTRTNFPILEVVELHYPHLLEEINFVEPMPSVKIFKLNENDHMDIEGMKLISSKFPNLEMLTLYTNLYVCDTGNRSKFDVLFHKLRILELYRISEMDANFLKVVLEKSPALKTLELFRTGMSGLIFGETDPLNGQLIEDLGHSMKNLERLILAVDRNDCIVGKVRLGYAAVIKILTFCPHLRCLGDLSEWKVPPRKMTRIIDSITANNWDIELVY